MHNNIKINIKEGVVHILDQSDNYLVTIDTCLPYGDINKRELSIYTYRINEGKKLLKRYFIGEDVTDKPESYKKFIEKKEFPMF